ncbi:MAG: GTP-binding protein [Gemmiger sp.]|nr:GTP-binding protein [Gemmiger sp.]
MAEKTTKIDIFSGFLGAGKTTLIKKLIKEAFAGEKLVLIENEFGEIGIDGGFMREAGVQVNELNSGCICCSLVGDFREALKKVVETYHPDRILIEPSGVGKLSDVTRAVEGVGEELPVTLNSFVTVADVGKVKLYMKNFGEFYDDQISHASCIILSRTGKADEAKISAAVAQLQAKNPTATIITTDWTALTGAQIVSVMDGKRDLVAELVQEASAANAAHGPEDEEDEHEHHHHHHHDEDGHECCHHHHDGDEDDDDDDEDEHEHHHHHDEDGHECCHHHHDGDDDDDDDEDDDEEHEHHHEGCCHHGHGEEGHDHEHGHAHGEGCGCHHHHHHDHDADEIFTSWGRETAHKYARAALEDALAALDHGGYGDILRAKGIVDGGDSWYEFDMVPGEYEVRACGPDVTGKLCVIGSGLDEAKIATLFGV